MSEPGEVEKKRGKSRLDVRLVELGLAETREKAQRMIQAGLVYAPDRRLDKPGVAVPDTLAITVKGPPHPYVSRGGLKLAGALDAFAHDPAGAVTVDLGASTGGFTDCLLQRGARLVYAIDVGRGQLHEKLRTDPRVRSHEKTHVDQLPELPFSEQPTLAVTDLSFISVTRALPPLHAVLAPGARAIILVKPQFEAGRERVPRGGIVRDPAVHRDVLDNVIRAAGETGFDVLGECASAIEGGDGNREFFLYLERC